jgi:hypothetical protein
MGMLLDGSTVLQTTNANRNHTMMLKIPVF